MNKVDANLEYKNAINFFCQLQKDVGGLSDDSSVGYYNGKIVTQLTQSEDNKRAQYAELRNQLVSSLKILIERKSGDQDCDTLRNLSDSIKSANDDANSVEAIRRVLEEVKAKLTISESFALDNFDNDDEIADAQRAESEAVRGAVDVAMLQLERDSLLKVDETIQAKVLCALDPHGQLVSENFISGDAMKTAFERALKEELATFFRFNITRGLNPARITDEHRRVLVQCANEQAAIDLFGALSALADFKDEIQAMGDGELHAYFDQEDPDKLLATLLEQRCSPKEMTNRLIQALGKETRAKYLENTTPSQRYASARRESFVKDMAKGVIVKGNAEGSYGETPLDILLSCRTKADALLNMSLKKGNDQEKEVDLFSSKIDFDFLNNQAETITDKFKKWYEDPRNSKYASKPFSLNPTDAKGGRANSPYENFLRVSNNKAWMARVTVNGQNLGKLWGKEPEAPDELEKEFEKDSSLNGDSRAGLQKLLDLIPEDVQNREAIRCFLTSLHCQGTPLDSFAGLDDDFGLGSQVEHTGFALSGAANQNADFYVVSNGWLDPFGHCTYDYKSTDNGIQVIVRGTVGPNVHVTSHDFNVHVPRAQFEATIVIPFTRLKPGEEQSSDQTKAPDMDVKLKFKPLDGEDVVDIKYGRELALLSELDEMVSKLPADVSAAIGEERFGLQGGKVVTQCKYSVDADQLGNRLIEAYDTVAKGLGAKADISWLKERLNNKTLDLRAFLRKVRVECFANAGGNLLELGKDSLQRAEDAFFEQDDVKDKSKQERYAEGLLSPRERILLDEDPTAFEHPVSIVSNKVGEFVIESLRKSKSYIDEHAENLKQENQTYQNVFKDWFRSYDYDLGGVWFPHLSMDNEKVSDEQRNPFIKAFDAVFTREEEVVEEGKKVLKEVLDDKARDMAILIANQELSKFGASNAMLSLGRELAIRFRPGGLKSDGNQQPMKTSSHVGVTKTPNKAGHYRISFHEKWQNFSNVIDQVGLLKSTLLAPDSMWEFSYSFDFSVDPKTNEVKFELVDPPKTTFELKPGSEGGVFWREPE